MSTTSSQPRKLRQPLISRIRGHLFPPLVLNSVAQVADPQRRKLDLAAEQTRRMDGAWKKAFSYFPVTLPTFMFRCSGHAVQTAIENPEGRYRSGGRADPGRHQYCQNSASRRTPSSAEGVTSTIQSRVAALDGSAEAVLEFATSKTRRFLSPPRTTRRRAGPGLRSSIRSSAERTLCIEAQKSFLTSLLSRLCGQELTVSNLQRGQSKDAGRSV